MILPRILPRNFSASALALVLAASLALSGCSTKSLFKSSEPVQTVYSLRPQLPETSESSELARTIEISKPVVPPGFDRDRIALYTMDGHKLDYFASARWPATFPEVMQNVTRRSASAVLPYIVAVLPEQSIDADYRLQTKINEFQPVYKGATYSEPPQLVADIEFTLLRLPDEQIVTSFTVARQVTAPTNRLDGITLEMEKMLQDIEREAFTRIERRLKDTAKSPKR